MARAASGAAADDCAARPLQGQDADVSRYKALGSYDRPVRNSRQAELYKLIYASMVKLGSELWHKVNRDEPDGQISLIVCACRALGEAVGPRGGGVLDHCRLIAAVITALFTIWLLVIARRRPTAPLRTVVTVLAAPTSLTSR